MAEQWNQHYRQEDKSMQFKGRILEKAIEHIPEL